MVDHTALRVHAARQGTRVHAPPADASTVRLALGVYNAFGAAQGRGADVGGGAGAAGDAAHVAALREGPAGRRVAGGGGGGGRGSWGEEACG